MSNDQDLARVQRRAAAEAHLLYKLKAIRALHIAMYSDMTLPLEKVAIEFAYAVGDIFEGVPVEELRLNLIKRDIVMEEMEDGG
jgi:hypothetical protein